MTFGGIVVKRSFDIAFSAALLLCALPVLMLAALFIRLTSPGPVLFRQTRMGRGFKAFEILKLRTMAHAEAGLAFTFGPDPRITPVGAILRRAKLDELPHCLWNVLRGQMSLVGTRPVVPELTALRVSRRIRLSAPRASRPHRPRIAQVQPGGASARAVIRRHGILLVRRHPRQTAHLF